jgi:hypothetical protein
MDLQGIVKRIDERLEATGQTAAAASRAAGLSEDAIRNIRRAAKDDARSGVSTNTIDRLAPVLETTVTFLLTGEGEGSAAYNVVPKVGYVGAGQAIIPFEADESDWVEAPPDVTPGTVAVEVRGESMLPAYEDGWLLYYSRKLPPGEMLNKRAVVQLADGRMLVKTIRRGTTPGYWNLGSLNAYDIEDQVVEWAAPIDWIKPR